MFLITIFILKYKTLLTNSHLLKKLINLVGNIKFVNNLYYFSKITLKVRLIISLFSIITFHLIN